MQRQHLSCHLRQIEFVGPPRKQPERPPDAAPLTFSRSHRGVVLYLSREPEEKKQSRGSFTTFFFPTLRFFSVVGP